MLIVNISPHLSCGRCMIVYREGVTTEHCEDCNICVEELDHHCPWSSKCIGRGNMLPFKAFVTSLIFLIVYIFGGGVF